MRSGAALNWALVPTLPCATERILPELVKPTATFGVAAFTHASLRSRYVMKDGTLHDHPLGKPH